MDGGLQAVLVDRYATVIVERDKLRAELHATEALAAALTAEVAVLNSYAQRLGAAERERDAFRRALQDVELRLRNAEDALGRRGGGGEPLLEK